MVSDEIQKLASEIFRKDPQIQHLGMIDLEGHVILDQSAGSSKPIEPNQDRIMFYYQVALRRGRREYFNQAYGQTSYILVVREKIQHVVLYLPLLTLHLTIDKSVSPDGIAKMVEKIKNIDKGVTEKAVKTLFYH